MIRLSISEEGGPPRLVTFNQDQVMIGRTGDCDLCLGGKGISSRHCRILRTPGGLQIEDLGSTNGTYVNRQKLGGPVPVGARDEIVIAVYRVQVIDDGLTAAHGMSAASPQSFAPAKPSIGPTDYMPAQPAPIIPQTGPGDMYRAGPAARQPTPGIAAPAPAVGSRSEPAVDPALAAWQREWEKLDVLSRAWLQGGRQSSRLLTGTKLVSARKWLAEGKGRQPTPKREQRDFIFASSRRRQLKIFGNVTVIGLVLGAATVATVVFINQPDPPPDEDPQDETGEVVDGSDGGEKPEREPPPDTLAASNAAAKLAAKEEDPVVGALIAIEAVRLLPEVEASRGAAAERVLRKRLGELIGIPLLGHEERINAAAFSPDGKWALTGSADASARLWDLTGEATRRTFALRGHTGPVTAVAISRDSKHAFTAGDGGKVFRWDLAHEDPPQTQASLNGLTAAATDVALSGDGLWLAAGCIDGSVRVWDASAPVPRSRELSGHTGPIRGVDINHDGTTVLAASEDTFASMWRMNGGEVGRRIKYEGHLAAVRDIALAPDGSKVLTGGDDGVMLWSPNRGKTPLPLLGHTGAVFRVAITGDSKLGITAGEDKSLRIWEIQSAAPTAIAFPGHEGEVFALALDGPREGDPRPNLALSGSADATARTWNLDKRAASVDSQTLEPHKGEVRAVAFAPDGHSVITGDASGAAKIWAHASPGADGASLVGRKHREPVTVVAINPSATRMVSGSADEKAVVWDLTKKGGLAIIDTLEGHEGAVDAVAINVDGKFVATGDAAGAIRLWDLSKAKPGKANFALSKHKRGVKQIVFTPDGKRLISLSNDAVWVWKLSADPSQDAQKLTHGDELVTMSLSPDGRWLMTGSVKSMRLWDLDAAAIAESGKALKKVHALDIAAVGVGPKGKWGVSSGKDATLFLWNLEKGGKARQLYLHEKQVDAVAFSADGHWLATGGRDNQVRLWNMTKDHPEKASLLLQGHEQRVGVLQFSADSRFLLSGSGDKTLRVWDLQSEDEATITKTAVILSGHNALVSSAQIAIDGHVVVSGSYDNTARMWPLVPHALIPIACRAVGRSFTDEEWQRVFPRADIQRTCG